MIRESDLDPMLLSQRPQTAFLGMGDDVFRQYSFHVISGFRDMLL